jgi:hypothetical protein
MEYAVTTLIVAVCGLIVLALSRPRKVLPALRHARGGLSLAIGIPLVILAYPVVFMLYGRQSLGGPAHGGEFSADLLGALFPTSFMRFAPAAWIRMGTSFVQTSAGGGPIGDYTENGSYLGIPLLCLCLYLTIRYWRDRWMRFLAGSIVVIYFFTLGAQLQVGGHYTAIKLPFAWLSQFPVFDNILPVRMAFLVTLFVALLLGYGLGQARKSQRDARATHSHERERSRRQRVCAFLESGLLVVLVTTSAIALIPRVPMYPDPSATVPSYFATSAVDRIPEGQPVLMFPYPYRYNTNPQLWQSMAGMRFRLIGGYGIFPGTNTSTDSYGEAGSPPIITAFLVRATMGSVPGGSLLPENVPTDPGRLVHAMRRYLRRQNVGTVLWVDDRANQNWGQCCGASPDPTPVYELFVDTLGQPTVVDGPVAAWYDVKGTLARSTRQATTRTSTG